MALVSGEKTFYMHLMIFIVIFDCTMEEEIPNMAADKFRWKHQERRVVIDENALTDYNVKLQEIYNTVNKINIQTMENYKQIQAALNRECPDVMLDKPATNCIEGNVIYAINCAGEEHVGAHGIQYKKDPIYGNAFPYVWASLEKNVVPIIPGAPAQDSELYRNTSTSQYGTLGYVIPIATDGDYILVLKFIEGNSHHAPTNARVQNVVLNNQFTVLSNLDVDYEVGIGMVLNKYVPFSFINGYLHYGSVRANLPNRELQVQFVKVSVSPIISAMYVVCGTIDNIPQ